MLLLLLLVLLLILVRAGEVDLNHGLLIGGDVVRLDFNWALSRIATVEHRDLIGDELDSLGPVGVCSGWYETLKVLGQHILEMNS